MSSIATAMELLGSMGIVSYAIDGRKGPSCVQVYKSEESCVSFWYHFVHISFWLMPMMLICLKEVYIYIYIYIYTLKENAEALVTATRETGLEVSADKTKYMVMSRDQNAGRNHSVRIDNSTFERVFKYLGTTLTNQNSIQEEIKSRLRSGNACYHSVQSLLSSKLLSKNLKTKIYRTIILPVVLYGCEAQSLIAREERKLRVFENMVLRRVFGPRTDEVTGEWRRLHNE